MKKKPNIIIVMADQQRHDLRKAAGYCLDTMPRLDAFGREGTDFSLAYTPNPTCGPARCSMFTGRYPSAHKVRTNHNMADALYEKDILDILKENGYETALCGKNHTYRDPAKDFDFDAETGHLGEEPGRDCEPADETMEAFRAYMKETHFIDGPEPAPFPAEYELPYRNTSSLLRFLDTRDHEKPFFAWLSFAEPHNPYQVPEPYYSMFPPETLPEIATAGMDLSLKGPRYVWLKQCWDKVLGDDPERIRRMRANYHGMLRLIDDQFGRMLDGLKARGLYDDTIVIYLSDHGDYAGEYGMMRKGADLPEVLTHIPLVIRVPGMKAQGRTGTGFVSIVDILPTLLNLLELPLPAGIQGKSFLPLLSGEALPEELKTDFSTVFSESGFGGLYFNEKDSLTPWEEGATDEAWSRFDCLNTWTQCGEVRMVRKGNYKLQLDMLGKGYLYDLEKDPQEVRDLYDDPAYAAVKTELLQELASYTLRAMDVLPVPRHRYHVKLDPKHYWFRDTVI